MPDSDQSLERLAELIWRTVKLRVALLVAGAVLLLITWSGLSNGNADANKLDIEYCTHVEQETSDALEKLAPSWKDRSSFYCSPANARLTIESGRAFSTILPLEGEPFERQKSELADYDRKRRAAYKLEIGLSSQGAESKIIVNALSVAQVVPFIVVVILAIVMILGFQQQAYRVRLRSLLAAFDVNEEQRYKIAETQFLSGFDVGDGTRSSLWRVLSPEGVAIAGLLASVTYLFVAVLAAFIVNLIHLTNSIFANYLFALYALVFLSVVALWRTHQKYRLHRHFRQSRFRYLDFLRQDRIARILVVVVVLSVFLPWTTPNRLRGYRFIFHQKALFMANGHAQYPLDPSLFVEVRVQLFIVAMFLVAVLLVPAFRKAGKGVRTAFSRAHQLLAFLTLFLILNYLLYMGSLEYLSMSDADFSAAWLMGVMNRDAGYTLSSYDPAYGFVIFVCCCLALCCFSLLAVESAGDND
jgi:hypothetical protein